MVHLPVGNHLPKYSSWSVSTCVWIELEREIEMEEDYNQMNSISSCEVKNVSARDNTRTSLFQYCFDFVYDHERSKSSVCQRHSL